MNNRKKVIIMLFISFMFLNVFNAHAEGIYNTDEYRENYGSNFYGTSNIREWLNSYEFAVSYTHNPPNDDNVMYGLNSYADEKGFLADGNFTKTERSFLAPRTHKVLLASIDSNVKDGGTSAHPYDNYPIDDVVQNYDNSYYKLFTDRVFLLSIKEIYDWVVVRGWEYRAKPTAKAVEKSEYKNSQLNTSYWYYWTNTPYASNSYYVRYVYSYGNVYNYAASNISIGVRPALNLKSEIMKSSGTATMNDPATLRTNGEPLEIGDYVVFGKYYDEPILWRVIHKDEQGTVLFSEYILSIKPFDASGDGTYPELSKTYGEIEAIPEPDTTPPGDVTNLTETHTETTVSLSWSNPTDEDFSHVILYKDEEIINDNVKDENIKINDLDPGTTYTFKLVAVDLNRNKSTGTSINVTTDEVKIEEVKNLKAEADYNRVDISWKLPESEYFHHVNIYRKQVEKQSLLEKLFTGTSVSAAAKTDEDEFNKMFETNGTYWNDFTVEPETTYEYKLTTESTTGIESEGQIVEVTTLEEPIPEMGGETGVTDDNGDYKVTWNSPTEGQVKILVDGTEYATVDASLQEYVIPAEDMVYDIFGNPKVQLVAVSSTGKEGKPTKPATDEGLSIPFGVSDFLITVMSLIALIAPFLLLILALQFAPRIVSFIRNTIKKYKEGRIRL